jgi:phage I-like protein
MNKPRLALCSASPIALEADGAPEWIQLLPAGEIRTHDGRGPYRVTDPAALMSASLPAGEKLVLDENHATDLLAPKGGSAPARGWIVELQAREGGIWGRVEWTGEGRKLIEDKAYRGVSPAILHARNGVVDRILRASLINTPNLVGMASLHSEGQTDMDWKVMLIELLGLDGNASDADIAAALKARMGDGNTETALQSALAPIALAVGLAETATPAAVLAGVKARAGRDESSTILALQGELATVASQLNELREAGTRAAAESFVDGAIRAGHVGVKPMRDRYVSLHMADPAGTEALIGALPVLHGTRLSDAPKPREDGALGEADQAVIALMGLDPEAYKKTLAAQAGRTEVL